MSAVEGWETIPLGELLVTKNNKAKQIKSSDYSAVGTYPVVDQSSEFICGYHDDPAKLIDTDLPLTIFGDHTRHTKFIDFSFIAGADGTQLLKPKQGIDDKFFYYLVTQAADAIGNYGYDRHFKHLKEYVCDYPCNKPEQTKIAEILSTMDWAIEQTEALIAKQQRIKNGLMQDLLTHGIDRHGNLRSEQTHKFKDSPLGRIPVEWAVKSVTELCDAVLDCKNRTPPVTSDGHPVIRTPNVKNGEFVFEDLAYTDPTSYEIWVARGQPRSGDVVITREAPVGEACLIPDALQAPCLGQRMMMYQPNPAKLRSDYLVFAIYSNAVQSKLLELAGGSTVGHIKVGDIRKLQIPYPGTMNEQRTIAETLTGSSVSIKQLESKRKKLLSIKTALMQDLLTGRKRIIALLDNRKVPIP